MKLKQFAIDNGNRWENGPWIYISVVEPISIKHR